MISKLKWWSRLACVSIAASAAAQNDPNAETQSSFPYLPPDFSQPVLTITDANSLPLADSEALTDLLMETVGHPSVGALTRGKAMALAFALGEREKVIDADFQLRHGQELTAVPVTPRDPRARAYKTFPYAESPMWKEADRNQDGRLTEEETGRRWSYFRRHDKNSDGIVTKDEVLGSWNTTSLNLAPTDVLGARFGPFMTTTRSPALLSFISDIGWELNQLRSNSTLFRPGDPANERPSADWSMAFPKDGPKTTVRSEINDLMAAVEPVYFNSSAAAGTSSPGSGGVGGFKKRQSLIKGLLVVQLEGSQHAGGASQMNATILAGAPGQPTRVGFNQPVGDSMDSGLEKVLKFVASRHQRIPDGQRIEISFESQYSPKDGDSASTACALMLDSLISGAEIDPGFAVTGALSPEGRVEAVGGLGGKIRGATKRNCTHVAIPKENEDVMGDLLITDGIGPMAAIQVFTIDTFDSARNLAAPGEERPPNLTEAMELFGTVQNVLQRQNGTAMLENRQVQQRLRKVVELAPNHASARYLLLQAIGKAPKSLTLQGSLAAIDQAALPLIQGLRNEDFRTGGNAFDSDEFADAMTNLRRVRPKLDQRAWRAADTISEFASLFRTLKNNPPNSQNALRELAEKIDDTAFEVQRAHRELVDILQRELGIETEDNP